MCLSIDLIQTCLGPYLIFFYWWFRSSSAFKNLLFADNLKIFSYINTEKEGSDFTQTYRSKQNNVQLNMNACLIITFTPNKQNLLWIYYTLNNTTLIWTQETISIKLHLHTKHYFSKLKNTNTPIILYNSSIRSRLQYGAVIWDPIHATYINSVEKIKRYLYFETHHLLHSYIYFSKLSSGAWQYIVYMFIQTTHTF